MAVNTTYTNPASSPPDLVTGQTLTQQAYEMILSNINATGGADGTGGVLGGVVPPGGILPYGAGTTDPTGWFLCDGRAISRTTYARLFTILSTTYGVGDGSSTFNIPDFRSRVAMSADNMGTGAGAASRSSGSNALGNGSGEDTHTLTSGESGTPVHTHAYTDPSHSHTTNADNLNENGANQSVQLAINVRTTMGGNSSTTGITISNATGASAGSAHNIRQNSLIANSIIKY